MKQKISTSFTFSLLASAFLLLLTACQKEMEPLGSSIPNTVINTTVDTLLDSANEAVLLAIDEDAIDNGNEPNYFTEIDVNDQISALGQRATLRYFNDHVGDTIALFSGEVGAEGWHAIKTIPNSWINAGPTNKGAINFLVGGPGLGSGSNDPEALLDNIPNVTPLRAEGLSMLTGKTILALVYDGDLGINYSPLTGSLKGETLGLVALRLIRTVKRTDGSSGSLPKVIVKIVAVNNARSATLKLFNNAPTPRSSSVPYDVNPPLNPAPVAVLNNAP